MPLREEETEDEFEDDYLLDEQEEEDRQSIIDAEEYYKYLLPSFTVDASSGGNDMAADPASTPDWITDYLNEDDQNYPDYPEDMDIGDDSLLFNDPDPFEGFTGVSNPRTGFVPTDVVDPGYSNSRTPSGTGFGGVNIGNTNVPFLGPLLAGAGLVNNNDDEETTLPLIPNENNDEEPPPPPPPSEEPPPNMSTRLIPSTQTGALPELSTFIDAFGPAASNIAGDMAGVAGAGLDAFARSQLGMTGDGPIAGFDIARETSRQQTGALGEASGAGADASYEDMINAFASPLQGVGQMRDTFQDLQDIRKQEMARLDQGLSGRQRRDAIEAGRAKSDSRGRDRLGDIDEIFSLVGADEGLRGQRLQNLFGAGELTADMATREAYALSPFTGAAVQAADLTPGLALAGDISRQASAATPSPMELFGLEGQERQFGLDLEALSVAEKTGNLGMISDLIGAFTNRPLNQNAGLGGGSQESGNPMAESFLNQFVPQQYRSQFGA